MNPLVKPLLLRIVGLLAMGAVIGWVVEDQLHLPMWVSIVSIVVLGGAVGHIDKLFKKEETDESAASTKEKDEALELAKSALEQSQKVLERNAEGFDVLAKKLARLEKENAILKRRNHRKERS
jgi:hypothetical protein